MNRIPPIPPIPSAAAPQRFGAYRVYERLGSGGMARVHRAERVLDDGGTEVVALKRLHPDLQRSGDALKAFELEAELAKLLTHPGIVRSVEHGHVDGEAYLAMEYIEGYELRQVLKQAKRATGPLPPRVVLSILIQLLKALDYAHQKRDPRGESLQLVHRDISPSNLLLTHDGQLKIIDFGIAKAMRDKASHAAREVKGKLPYMSPEAIAGRPLDARADLWSVGVIAHELCSARSLFACPTDYDTVKRVRSGKIPPCSRVNPECPKDLDAIIAQSLRRIPDSRWQSAGAMLDALEAAAERHGLDTNRSVVASWLHEAFKDGVALEAARGKERSKRPKRGTAPMGHQFAPGPSASLGPSNSSASPLEDNATIRRFDFVRHESSAGHLAELEQEEGEAESQGDDARAHSLEDYSRALEESSARGQELGDEGRTKRRARSTLDKPLLDKPLHDDSDEQPTLVRQRMVLPSSAPERTHAGPTRLDKLQPEEQEQERVPTPRPLSPRPRRAQSEGLQAMGRLHVGGGDPLPTLREPTVELDAEPMISYRETGVTSYHETGVTGPALYARGSVAPSRTPIPLRAPRQSTQRARSNTTPQPPNWPHGTLAPPPPQGGDRLVHEAKLVQGAQLRTPRSQSYDHREAIRARRSGPLPLIIVALGAVALAAVGISRLRGDDGSTPHLESPHPAQRSEQSTAPVAVDASEMVKLVGNALSEEERALFTEGDARALVCVDPRGVVQSAKVTGPVDEAKRSHIESELATWRYEPVEADGKPSSACFVMQH